MNGGLHSHNPDDSPDLGHGHIHSTAVENAYPNGHAGKAREGPAAQLLSMAGGRTADSAAAGMTIVAPTGSRFSSYEGPPDQSHIGHVHYKHHHSAEASFVTDFFLRYTSNWPMLHTIMTDKDSRRILYFMMYVRPS